MFNEITKSNKVLKTDYRNGDNSASSQSFLKSNLNGAGPSTITKEEVTKKNKSGGNAFTKFFVAAMGISTVLLSVLGLPILYRGLKNSDGQQGLIFKNENYQPPLKFDPGYAGRIISKENQTLPVNGDNTFASLKEMTPEQMTPDEATGLVINLLMDFFVHIDLQAENLMTGSESKQKDPALYEGVKIVINTLKERINPQTLKPHDLPMPDNKGAAMNHIEMLAQGAGGVLNYTDEQTQQFKQQLIKGTGRDITELNRMQTPYGKSKDVNEVFTSWLNGFCTIDPIPGCQDFVLVRMTEEGRSKEKEECRPETYVVIDNMSGLFQNVSTPIIFTEKIANIFRDIGINGKTNNPDMELLIFILLHEMTHSMGTLDIYIADLVEFFKTTPQEKRAEGILQIIRDFIRNFNEIVDKLPAPLVRGLVTMYSRYVTENGIDYNEKDVDTMLDPDWIPSGDGLACDANRFSSSEQNVMDDIKILATDDKQFMYFLLVNIADTQALFFMLKNWYGVSVQDVLDDVSSPAQRFFNSIWKELTNGR